MLQSLRVQIVYESKNSWKIGSSCAFNTTWLVVLFQFQCRFRKKWIDNHVSHCDQLITIALLKNDHLDYVASQQENTFGLVSNLFWYTLGRKKLRNSWWHNPNYSKHLTSKDAKFSKTQNWVLLVTWLIIYDFGILILMNCLIA